MYLIYKVFLFIKYDLSFFILTCSVKLELRFLFEESSLMTLKSDFIRCPSSKGTITFAFKPWFLKKRTGRKYFVFSDTPIQLENVDVPW